MPRSDGISPQPLPTLPYWLVNVSRDKWPSSCPDFLRDASLKNWQILATPDEEYHLQNWDEVQGIIESNSLSTFSRLPSDLRRYWEYIDKVKKRYGSVMQLVLNERLHWTNLEARGAPFEFADDYKFVIEDEPFSDEPTTQMKSRMEDFVQEKFVPQVPRERVGCFRNWKSIKSVHAIEHFHVMIYKPDPDFVREVTGSDGPISEIVQK